MPTPTYTQLVTLTNRENGLLPESIEERILTILAMLASGASPDGTAVAGPLPATATKYVSGQWYGPSGGTVSTATRPNGFMTCIPFRVDRTLAITAMGIEVTGTPGNAGAVLRLGIYADNNGQPGALSLDAGTVTADTAATKTVAASFTFAPGWWWLAACAQNAATTQPTTRMFVPGNILDGSPRTASGGFTGCGWINGAAGQAALPNPAAVTTIADTAYIVTVQAA